MRHDPNNTRLKQYNKMKSHRVAKYTRNNGQEEVSSHIKGGIKMKHDIYGIGRLLEEDLNKGGFIPFQPLKTGKIISISSKRLTKI